MSSTERAQETRRRKREGLRLLRLEIRETEIDVLIEKKLLLAAERDDAGAVAEAVYRLLDAVFPALEDGELKV